MDHRDGHDVEDAALSSVVRVAEFFVTPALAVGCLNLSIDLASICAFEIDAIFPVRGDGAADGRVGGLLLRDLLDVEGFLICDVELGANLVNHVLNGDFIWRWASAFFAFAWLQLHRPGAGRDALILDRRLDDLRLPNLFHQVRHTALLDELRADVFRKRGEVLQLRRIGEEAGEEVECLHKAGEQIDERLALLCVRNLRVKPSS